jgi:tryptophan synthase alpha chain
MAELADGVIVGSAIIKILEKYGKDAPPQIGDFVRAMKQAIVPCSAEDTCVYN